MTVGVTTLLLLLEVEVEVGVVEVDEVVQRGQSVAVGLHSVTVLVMVVVEVRVVVPSMGSAGVAMARPATATRLVAKRILAVVCGCALECDLSDFAWAAGAT